MLLNVTKKQCSILNKTMLSRSMLQPRIHFGILFQKFSFTCGMTKSLKNDKEFFVLR